MSQTAVPTAARAAATTDVPAGLVFVDPNETDATYRVCLWAAPGSGKSVAAASAPGPILVLTADRPSAYRFARKHWKDVEAARANDGAPPRPAPEILEVRYQGADTLTAVYRYLESDDGAAIKTLVVDPVSNVIDQLRDVAPLRGDGDLDHEWVNKKVLGFITSLRRFDVHVVLVAHERLNDGKKGDGKLYPALGGPTLINKILAELDIAAHVERVERDVEGGESPPVWIGQLQPRGNLVCKESTGVLGDRRIADLARWFEVATEALAPDDSDVPWGEGYEPPADDQQAQGEPPGPAVEAPSQGEAPAAPRAPEGGPDELPSAEEAAALLAEARAHDTAGELPLGDER